MVDQIEHLTDGKVDDNRTVEMYSEAEDGLDMGLVPVRDQEQSDQEGKPEMGIVERRLQTLKKRLSGLLLLDSDSEGDRPPHISEEPGEDDADGAGLDGRSVQNMRGDGGSLDGRSNTGTFIEKEGQQNYSILMERLGAPGGGGFPSQPPTPVNSVTPPPPPPADFSCDPEITEALTAMRDSLKVCSHYKPLQAMHGPADMLGIIVNFQHLRPALFSIFSVVHLVHELPASI